MMHLSRSVTRIVVLAGFFSLLGCRVANEASFLAVDLDRSLTANERQLLARHCGVDDLATYTYSYSGPPGLLSVWWEVWEDGKLNREVARATVSLAPSCRSDNLNLVRDSPQPGNRANGPQPGRQIVKHPVAHWEGAFLGSWDTESSSQGETAFRFAIDIQETPARGLGRSMSREPEFPGALGILRFDEALRLAPTDRTSPPVSLGKTDAKQTRILRAVYFTTPRISKVWSIPPWEQQGVVAFFLKMRVQPIQGYY